MTTHRTVTADIIKRAAEDSVSVYLDDFPGAAWDDGWFTAAYEIDSSGNGPCDGVTWEVYRDACKAAFVARRPVTGPDGDNPITDEQLCELYGPDVAFDDEWVEHDGRRLRLSYWHFNALHSSHDAIRDRARGACAAAYNARHASKEKP